MKFINLVLLFVAAAWTLQASPPDWSVNASAYAYSMTYTGAINIDYEESTNSNDIIAAFVGDECRGVAQPVFRSAVNRYLCYLMIYSNASEEPISFKVYDASADEILDIEKTAQFKVNGTTGSMEKPYIWSTPTLSSESNMLSFGIPGQIGDTEIGDTTITLKMPWGSERNNLVAEFTPSEHAFVYVGDTLQQSGVTPNNFSEPVVYRVRSADETDTTFYKVHVLWFNHEPLWISLSDTLIDENYEKDAFVGYFSTRDSDFTDIHAYSLVDGPGDYDNFRFYIDGNKLLLDQDVYFETTTTFTIRVCTDDGKGGEFERSMKIVVKYLSQHDEIRAGRIISPNGDGLFDTWTIQNPGLYRDCDIYILNSAGEIVFQSKGYETEWDGRYNGKDLPIGAYYYIVRFPDGKTFKGTISLIR